MVAQLSSTNFYGSSTGRWIGQIADDSSWRDNILPGKFESANTIPGWGRRYKVRIMGVHDQQQETIPDDQLPWANIEYPVTAGNGIGGAFQTSQIRQGMFVMGEWMDEDEQVPMITGLLGNNAQTAFEMATGMTGGEAFKAFSGFSEVKEQYKGSSKPKVAENDLVTGAPSKEASNPPPGSIFDKFGIAGNATPRQLAMISSAMATGGASGLAGVALDTFVKDQVTKGTKNIKATDGLASKGPISNPTKENPDAVHQLSAGDLKRQRKLEEKIVTMKPDDPVKSAMKGIQTVTENLSKELQYVQDAIRKYSGAVSAVGNPMADMQKLIGDAACQMAKYMKIVFDKVMNYVTKQLNIAMTKVISAMPMSMRYQMSDLKESITELTLCMYGKMTNSLCGTIAGLLNDLFNPSDLEKKAKEDAFTAQDPDAPNTYTSVPACTAEGIVGEVLAIHKDQIEDANNSLIDNINAFLEDLQSQLAGVSGTLSDIMSKMGGINGSITSALGFMNIKLNVFGCELKPAVSMSDYYTLARGGSSTPEQQVPSTKGVEERAQEPATHSVPDETPFVEPTKETTSLSDLQVGDNISQITDEQERNEIEADLEAERALTGDRSRLDDALTLY